MNQLVTFFTDGGEDIRELPRFLNPEAEHILDWFHLTMRLTVLGQIAKGLAGLEQVWEDDEELEAFDLVWTEKRLERLKWYLWHGNVYQALQIVERMEWDLEGWDTCSEKAVQLLKAVQDFGHYIETNQNAIPNYGDRYRHGETISTSFVESAVNQVVSKRMVKRQQMRWTKPGAHFLLQIRTQVLNEDLRNTFSRWYPGMEVKPEAQSRAA